MANRITQLLQVVTRKQSNAALLKSNSINCWGSNQKVRHSPKLLGFSASIAVFGFGIHQIKHNAETSRHRRPISSKLGNGIENSIQQFRNTVNNLFSTEKKCTKNAHKSSLNPVRLLGLLTPVHCLSPGEDTVCNCCGCPAGCCNQPSAFKQEQKQESCECNKNDLPGNNSQPQPAPSPSISNRPCHSASSSCISDIDIESLSIELGGVKQVNWVVESDLSHCHLIRQASQVTVDCVTRLLTETASAYEDYQAEYRRLLDVMMDTLEDSRKACGAELEVIDCKLILARAKLDEMKSRIQELEVFMHSLEKLGNASAETSFMAHAEYASIAMSERMHSMGLEVKRLRDETKEKERDMLELQSLIIVETGKGLK